MLKFHKTSAFFIFWFVLAQGIFSCQPDKQSDKQQILIGTYTKSTSEGIYACSFDPTNEILALEGLVAKIQNPSFLALSDDRQYVFAVGETKGGTVTAFQRKGSQLTQISQQPTGGAGPCHVDISPDQRFVAVANYSGGNFSVLAKNDNGELAQEVATIQHSGRSVDSTRQRGPHAHCVKWIGERYCWWLIWELIALFLIGLTKAGR